MVYPSANHTRFEHSLGVSHLAKKLLLSLKEKNPFLDVIDDNLIELVQIAGLIHDIGHGPFSHLYDDYMLSRYFNDIFLISKYKKNISEYQTHGSTYSSFHHRNVVTIAG